MRGARGQRSCGGALAWAGLVVACVVMMGPVARGQGADGATVAGPMPAPSRESLPLGPGKALLPSHGVAKAESTVSAGSMVQTVLTLGAVVAVILLAGAGVRRLARTKGGLLSELGAGGRAPAGVLEVLGRYPISRGSTLVLLKLDRRVLLTCQTHGRKSGGPSMSTLCEINDPEEVASLLMKTREEEGDSLAKKFQSILTQEEAWPKPVLVGDGEEREAAVARSEPVQAVGAEDADESLVVQVPARRATERQLSAAMSVLRTRAESLAETRQPMAKGGRA